MKWKSSVFLRLVQAKPFVFLNRFWWLFTKEREGKKREWARQKKLQVEKRQQEKELHLSKLTSRRNEVERLKVELEMFRQNELGKQENMKLEV